MNDDLYARLGVARNAPAEVISAAYKALLKRHHPDLAADDDDRVERERVSRMLGEAHAVLTDPAARRDYDQRHPEDEQHAGHRTDEHEHQRRGDASPGSGHADDSAGGDGRASRTSHNKEHSKEGRGPNPPRGSWGPDGLESPSGEVIRRYDDLSVTARRRLDLLAFADRDWRRFRRALLATRARLGGFPLSWFGTTDPVPATPASWRLVGAMVGSFNATLIAASLLWATGWFRTLASDVVGELWLVPVVQVPVIAVGSLMVTGSVLILWWFRRYGGWFSMSPSGRLRLSIWSTGWGLITMVAPLLVLPGVIVAALVAAGLWWSQR